MKILKKLATAIPFIIASYMPLKAQTISGQITDLFTKQGIPNLEVIVGQDTTYTDSEGHYDLSLAINIKDEPYLPRTTKLHQNYPNPFNPKTAIKYSLEKTTNVNLVIYDLLGREVKNLVSKKHLPGTYEVIWDGTNKAGKKVANNIYIYRLISDDVSESKKMSLIDGVNTSSFSGNLERKINGNNSLGRTLNKTSTVNFQVRDEDIPAEAFDSTSYGGYFDYSEDIDLNGNVEKNVVMIPNLSWDSEVYPNILNFVKFMTRSDSTNGNTTLIKWTNLPIKTFYNRGTEPHPNYITALETALGDSSNADGIGWENSTSFNYKEQNFPAINIFEESAVDPDTGIVMDYTTDFSHVIFDEWAGPPWQPIHSTVYIDNTTNPSYIEIIIKDHLHELGHVLFSSGRESDDSTHVMNSTYNISNDEGKAVRIIYELPNFQDMGYYLED